MLRCLLLILLLSLASCGRSDDTFPTMHFSQTASRPISYNRDIRPILSNHCFRCHGPDEAARKRNLRLDTAEGSRALLKSKLHAIVPGSPDSSELVNRITSQDPDDVMPPPELHLPLSQEHQQLLVDWIKQGAEYEPHWAFTAPKKTAPPTNTNVKGDEIDLFVATRLDDEGLAPAPQADRATLLRRVALTLTGLPPTAEELDTFIADTSPDAYEKQVDRLLASPHYGERMAADWLDVARFADTYGYQSDWECRVWPWRDWLINSFNSNQPYNEFIRDQLAGDLLPDATTAQKIATAFNRLHRQTNEGGSIDEEFRREYISDRIATYSTAFLGLTVECARCHDHKYDPIPQQDYYSLGAFFSIDEAGTYPYSTPAIPRPALRLPTAAQQVELNRLRDAVAAAELTRDSTFQSQSGNYGTWLNSAQTINVKPPINRVPLEGTLTGPILSTGETLKATLLDGDTGPSLKDIPAFKRSDPRSLVFWMNCPDTKSRAAIIHTSTFTIESDEQGYQVMLKDGHLCWELIHYWPGSAAAIRTASPFPLNRWVQVAVTYDGSSLASGLHIYLDGQLAPTEIVRDHLDGPATVRTFQIGFRDRDLGFKGGGICDLQIFDRALTAPEIAELKTPGTFTPASALNDPFSYFTTNINAECIAASKSLQAARAAYHALLESIPEIMVMEESRYPRDSFILTRGQYDQPDHTRPVHPDRAIEGLLPFNQSLPHNRLGLATWTTDSHNPLTARVAVNRLWAICFSRGLLPTLENFGLQSEPPSHPELLDNLTLDFIASKWDVKALLRRIVLSHTFRQSSVATEEKLVRDPSNALLSRGPSSRLSAEVLRDQALAASGLLAPTIGGPSVKPWQPPGLWADSGVASQGDYKPDTGDNAHRRSVYTYRKRTSPPPNMLAFDAGSRELCLARRQPTNTPLQPLVLLNDPVFFECARALAARVIASSPDPTSQISLAFRLLTSREPRQPELAALFDLYNTQLADLTAKPDASQKILGSKTSDPALAALTLTCSTILASDASVTSR